MCIIRQLMYEHSIIDYYPRLLDDESEVPEACESSVSSQEETSRHDSFRSIDYIHEEASMHDSFRSIASNASSCKMSQDILIFKKIAAVMPPKSMLHLLKGVQTSSESEEPKDFILASYPTEDMIQVVVDKTKRKVRFQDEQNTQVKLQVFEVPRHRDPALWWQAEECSRIRAGCRSLSEHFLYYQEDYISSVERLRDSECKSVKKIGKAMDSIARHTICRGMESHIVRSCRAACKKHSKNVLREQARVNKNKETLGEDGLEQIRNASRQSSLGGKFLALKLAQNDAFQARGVECDSSLLPVDLI